MSHEEIVLALRTGEFLGFAVNDQAYGKTKCEVWIRLKNGVDLKVSGASWNKVWDALPDYVKKPVKESA